MVKAIVGANWGDEGKGKITDMLAENADIVIRFQGGSNAGHTIKNKYGKFALHMLPSGIFSERTTCVLGNGVALNIPKLIEEINSLVEQGVIVRNRSRVKLCDDCLRITIGSPQENTTLLSALRRYR